jgi:hypothetical protein
MKKTFILRSRVDAYQTGKTSGGDQVVMGMLFPWAVVVYFTPDGAFLKVEKKRLDTNAAPEQRFQPDVEDGFRDVLRSWQGQIGYLEAPIQLQQFFLNEYRIGIRDLPSDLQDYLNNPERYPGEDHEEFLNDIESWKEEGNYVFWWGTDYPVNTDGETL